MKTYLATREFWAGALERAVRAAAWTLAAVLGVPNAGEAVGVDVRHVGWRDAATLAAGAALASVVASIVAGKMTGPSGSPSLVDDRPRAGGEAFIPRSGDLGRSRRIAEKAVTDWGQSSEKGGRG